MASSGKAGWEPSVSEPAPTSFACSCNEPGAAAVRGDIARFAMLRWLPSVLWLLASWLAEAGASSADDDLLAGPAASWSTGLLIALESTCAAFGAA